MTAKEILITCRDSVLHLRKLDEQLQLCLPTEIKVQQYDAAPPGTNDPTAAAIQLYDGLLAQRDELARQLSQLMERAWHILHAVRDARLLAILSNYYLQGQTDQEIARAQHLTRVYITQLRRAALAALQD